jgi:hypothetical protein
MPSKRVTTVPEEARALLISFAIWFSSVWEEDNSDDVEAATKWVDHFLGGGSRA